MLDSLWALILPTALSTYNMMIMRTALAGVPKALEEAAEIDGCSIFQYFIKIVLPLSKSIIAIMVLYYAVGHWNDYYTALIYISNRDLIPLQTALREVLISSASVADLLHNADSNTALMMQQKMELAQSLKYTSIIAGIIPMMIAYPLFRNIL